MDFVYQSRQLVYFLLLLLFSWLAGLENTFQLFGKEAIKLTSFQFGNIFLRSK
ncbi:hypothetical protein [Bacillus sp. 491mf]|uniref:hypothetical protein n=1 Tax=Bacillus sp. 491mf TaxID=1761755 RepID=UPI001C4304D7|nr:hypothetical protein [Bacillus sp. 491mf]